MRFLLLSLLLALAGAVFPADPPRADLLPDPVADLIAWAAWRAPTRDVVAEPALTLRLPDQRRADTRLVAFEQASARRERTAEHLRGAA